ncbi:sigma-70 family RNA polymerase sigma factor [Ktedonosporobacter rubrisoli]|uniref:Sigma-70 family RNA polymerase sigma factor n=1 Tax=Ktedonosporobacter rubrisoli TaxID=2509675 RepID=A0A4P6JRJ1_KTERU|nr:sigma-70 family RNA polymerase sigma factor [Ktedonosporobacter rubrisoli]QBD77915.1 sigma-70 family RNA polymerase sigma factor [Ktedonosporobacter rubrisoli]
MQEEDGSFTEDYSKIFSRFSPVIFSYLLLHASSREEAEDLTIEVFTSALEHEALLTWSEPRQLAWLKRVAYTRLVDTYRRSKRRPTIALDQMAPTVLTEHDPESLALLSEDYAQLRSYIQQLTLDQQQLLRLRYGNELHTAEIATMLNKSDQSIRQMLSRTINLLRTMYNTHPARKGGNI